jgi:selenocysteine-specific elongation factor
MILVIDITKGMQTQTAECLVIGEITCPKILVVLNKVDLLPPDKKDAMIEKVIRLTLTGTVWTGYPLVPLPLFLKKTLVFGQIENISFSSYFVSFYE